MPRIDLRADEPLPKSVEPGRVLCHNHIRHTVKTLSGVNGFRAFTVEKSEVPEGFVDCSCGWSGLPHKARADFAALARVARAEPPV